jgi:hypothetical protein
MIQVFRMDGSWIVSEIETIDAQEWGDPDAVLKYPYEVVKAFSGGGISLEKYPPYSANREEIPIRSSDVVITTDVDDSLASLYQSQRKKETE